MSVQELGLSDEKTSTLFSIVKEVHRRSVGERLTVERSFRFLSDTMLNHSVHRCDENCAHV